MKEKITSDSNPDFIITLKGIKKPIAIEIKGLPRKDYMLRKKLFISMYKHVYLFLEIKAQKKLTHMKSIFDKYK